MCNFGKLTVLKEEYVEYKFYVKLSNTPFTITMALTKWISACGRAIDGHKPKSKTGIA
jgi:hypothetical protein